MTQMATRCGSCQHKLRMPRRYHGRRVNCPHCNARLLVPSPAEVEAALPERYLCTHMSAEEDLLDEEKPHPADPTLNDATSAYDTLVIRETTGEYNRLHSEDLPSLDDLLEGPDVEYAGQPPVSKDSGTPDAVVEAPPMVAPKPIPEINLDDSNERAPLPHVGYRLEGNHIAIHDANLAYFDHIASVILALPGNREHPIRIDLRELGHKLKLSQIRRLIVASLLANQVGRRAHFVLTDAQRAMFNELRLAQIVKVGD